MSLHKRTSRSGLQALRIVCRIIAKSALLLMVAVPVQSAFAQAVGPDELLKTVTSDVLATISGDHDIRSGNVTKLVYLVEARILPLFDFNRMTRNAMARNWRLATPLQQTALTAEFKTLLVRTYSVALSSYRDQAVEFRRLRAAPEDTEVTVRFVIKQPGAESLSMDYDMEKSATGWKVYDIKIDGVSLITTYQDSFAGKVRDGGVDALIKALADKNQQGDARFHPRQSENFQIYIFVQSLLQGGR